MTENTGKDYRSHQAVLICILIIAVAVALLLAGYLGFSWTVAAGAFLFIAGLAVAGIAHVHSDAPDKFGPSESAYRLVIGAVITLIGAIVALLGFGVDYLILVVILLIGIALIGLGAVHIGKKTSKY